MLNLIHKLFCKHEYRDVDERGYQTCKNCNKSVYVGFPECKHVWKVAYTIHLKRWWTKTEHMVYVQQCETCGEMKNHSSNA